MNARTTTTFAGPVPRGIHTESTSSGISVHVSGNTIAFSDRRLWIAALLKIFFVVVLVAAIALTKGAGRAQLRYVPMVFYFALITGLFTVIRTRRRLSNGTPTHATLTLADDRLTIAEPRIRFNRGGQSLDLMPSELDYELPNVEYFAFGDVTDAPLFQRALEIHLIDGSVQYHLRNHNAEQLRWICNWLSTSLRAALR